MYNYWNIWFLLLMIACKNNNQLKYNINNTLILFNMQPVNSKVWGKQKRLWLNRQFINKTLKYPGLKDS